MMDDDGDDDNDDDDDYDGDNGLYMVLHCAGGTASLPLCLEARQVGCGALRTRHGALRYQDFRPAGISMTSVFTRCE